MVSKIQALRDDCLKRVKSKNELEEFQSNISFEELDTGEIKQFVKLCDNRIEYSKTFLNVTIWIMGIIFTALLIVFSISFGKDIPIPAILIIVLLLVSFSVLFVHPHHRHNMSHISGWTAFKEMALMNSPEKTKESKTSEEELDS